MKGLRAPPTPCKGSANLFIETQKTNFFGNDMKILLRFTNIYKYCTLKLLETGQSVFRAN